MRRQRKNAGGYLPALRIHVMKNNLSSSIHYLVGTSVLETFQWELILE